MLDKKEFGRIQKTLEEFEEKREEVIRLSRDIIKLSKQIIYGVQRDSVDENHLKSIKLLIKKLPKDTYDTGMGNVAYQEYVEALCFYYFIKDNKLPTAKELGVDDQSYLLGLCDLTGEMVRKGVNAVIKKKYTEAERLKTFVEEIYGAFLEFEFRNGELRKKSEQIRWNLNKLQDLMYDVAIKEKK